MARLAVRKIEGDEKPAKFGEMNFRPVEIGSFSGNDSWKGTIYGAVTRQFGASDEFGHRIIMAAIYASPKAYEAVKDACLGSCIERNGVKADISEAYQVQAGDKVYLDADALMKAAKLLDWDKIKDSYKKELWKSGKPEKIYINRQ